MLRGPVPRGTERGKQGLLGYDGKFLLPPAVYPFLQQPFSCTVSHSPAGKSSQGEALLEAGLISLPSERGHKGRSMRTEEGELLGGSFLAAWSTTERESRRRKQVACQRPQESCSSAHLPI